MRTGDSDKKTITAILEDFLAPCRQRVALGTERQLRYFAHEKPDAWPIRIAADSQTLERVQAAIPSVAPEDTAREFFRILLESLRVTAGRLTTNSDWAPSFFPAYGCGVSMTALGLKQKREHGTYGAYGPPDALPQEQALALSLDDVRIRGDFKRRLELIGYARAMLDDELPILCSYTAGPLSFACELMGADFMMLTASDPDEAHRFLDFCTDAIGKILGWLREAAGADACANTPLGSQSIVRGAKAMQVDDDHAVMFSPQAIDEYVIPSVCELSRRCGLSIGTLHYCGWHAHLSRAITREQSIRAFNNNPIPQKAHAAPFDEVMRWCAETGTIYNGYWPKQEAETLKAYLKRLHAWAERGLLFPEIPSFPDLEGFASAAEMADYWYQL